MKPDTVRAAVLDAISEVAPEAELDSLESDADLRDALDIDSMDFLNVLVAIEERLGVDVPEKDYADVATLDSLVAYVTARCPQSALPKERGV